MSNVRPDGLGSDVLGGYSRGYDVPPTQHYGTNQQESREFRSHSGVPPGKPHYLENSAFRLTTVASVLIAVVVFTWKASQLANGIERFKDETNVAIEGILKTLDRRYSEVYGSSPEAFRRRDMAEFCRDTEQLNKQLGWRCSNPYTMPSYLSRLQRNDRVDKR